MLAPKTLASAKFQLTSVNLQTTGRYLKKFTRCVGLEKTNKAQSRYTLNDTFKQQLMASILVLHGPNLNLLGMSERCRIKNNEINALWPSKVNAVN